MPPKVDNLAQEIGSGGAKLVRPPRRKRTRAEKFQDVRRALFAAAARVVGRYGYAEASVARITSQAKVAQGTFYNHFESRQALLDQLLPSMGDDMLNFIRDQIATDADEITRERQRFGAYFVFLQRNPEFYRILTEADLFAPSAYRQHIQNMATRYLRAMRRARDNGSLSHAFSDAELEVVVYMMLGIRSYIGLRYALQDGKIGPLPDEVPDTIMKVLTRGLFRK